MTAGWTAGFLVHLAVIALSSTAAAKDFSICALRFYEALLGIARLGIEPGFLAEKGGHIALFFSLGSWLCHGMNLRPVQKLFQTAVVCLVVGIGAEALQLFFSGCHAAVVDVVLNGASRMLGSALVIRWDLSSAFSRPLIQ